MLRHALDTNLCIRVLRARPPTVGARFNAAPDELSISSVVLGELLYGAEKSGRLDENRREVEGFASRLQVLPYDEPAALHVAEIRANLERRGQRIGGFDVLIAGHARSLGLIVVTGNPREFERVQGPRCEGWL